jgi:hypothetical protein
MGEFENLISEAFGIEVFSYNKAVTNDVWNVFKIIKEDRPAFVTDIAKRLGLSDSHVELIQYLICNNDHAEYGSSPRGCWLTPKGEALYLKLLSADKDDQINNANNSEER